MKKLVNGVISIEGNTEVMVDGHCKDVRFFIGGEEADLADLSMPYPHLFATTGSGRFTAIGLHGETPSESPYLEKILLVSNATGAWAVVPVYGILGKDENGKLESLEAMFEEEFWFRSRGGTCGVVRADLVFMESVEMGAFSRPAGDPATQLEALLDFQIGEELSIVMTLRDDVPRKELLRFRGFGLEFDCFKLWGISGEAPYYECLALFGDSETNAQVSDRLTVSRTGRYDQMVESLLECASRVFPNHPAFYKPKMVVEELPF